MNLRHVTAIPIPHISNFGDDKNGECDSLLKEDISTILDKFCRQSMVREEATKKGIGEKFFMSTYNSFRLRCLDLPNLKPELRVLFSDIKNHDYSVDLLFSYFLEHARLLYPHLDSQDDMKLISDLTQPHNWYPEARSIHRRVIFHSGTFVSLNFKLLFF